MLFPAIDWCMISIHHWIVMSVQSLGVHLSTVLIVTVPSMFVARCSPFHCPYYCTFTVCLLLNVHLSTVLISHCTFTVFLLPSFFTFPLSLSSLYLHCLLSSAHLSTVLFTVPSLFVVQCTPFHRPQQSLYLPCLSVALSTAAVPWSCTLFSIVPVKNAFSF